MNLCCSLCVLLVVGLTSLQSCKQIQTHLFCLDRIQRLLTLLLDVWLKHSDFVTKLIGYCFARGGFLFWIERSRRLFKSTVVKSIVCLWNDLVAVNWGLWTFLYWRVLRLSHRIKYKLGDIVLDDRCRFWRDKRFPLVYTWRRLWSRFGKLFKVGYEVVFLNSFCHWLLWRFCSLT